MRFAMNQAVILKSEEFGKITARAEYLNSEASYLVEYVDKIGCYQSKWFTEHELSPSHAPNFGAV